MKIWKKRELLRNRRKNITVKETKKENLQYENCKENRHSYWEMKIWKLRREGKYQGRELKIWKLEGEDPPPLVPAGLRLPAITSPTIYRTALLLDLQPTKNCFLYHRKRYPYYCLLILYQNTSIYLKTREDIHIFNIKPLRPHHLQVWL